MTAKGGIRVDVRVTPNASGNRLAVKEGQLCAWVTAPPEKGKANEAVKKLLARAWTLPKTSLSVTTGQSSRHKALAIDFDTETVARKLGVWAMQQKGEI